LLSSFPLLKNFIHLVFLHYLLVLLRLFSLLY